MLAPILAGLAGLAALCSNPPKRRKRKAPRRGGFKSNPWPVEGSKSNPRRKGRRVRVDEAASRLAWWRWHHNPSSRDLSKVIQALNNPRRRRSRK